MLKHTSRLATCLIAASLALAAARSAQAVDVNWNNPLSGNWDDDSISNPPGNWVDNASVPAPKPAAGDLVRINNGGEAVLSTDASAAATGEFNVGRSGGTGIMTTTATGVFVAAGEVFVGQDGGSVGTVNNSGSFSATGGGGYVNIGRDLGNGTLNNNFGATFHADQELRVGMWGGTGAVSNSGIVDTTTELRIGMGHNGNGQGVGTFDNLNAVTANSMYVGRDGGDGTFTNIGTVVTQNQIWVGQGTGDGGVQASHGVLNIDGGSIISKYGDFLVGNNVGASGRAVGVVNQTDGLLDVNGGDGVTASGNWDKVGNDGGDGTYNMSGGSYVARNRSVVGWGEGTQPDSTVVKSVGVINHTGGNMTYNELWVGSGDNNNPGHAGTGTVNTVGNSTGGSFNVNVLGIGQGSGTGTMNQTAGVISTGNDVHVGSDALSHGEYNLSAGATLNVGAWTYVGRDGGTGVFNNNGTINGNGDMYFGRNGGNGTMNNSATGVINDNSGWLYVGNGPGATGLMNNDGAVTVQGRIQVGHNGATGVLNNSATGVITAGANGGDEVVIGDRGDAANPGAFGTVNNSGVFNNNGNLLTVGWGAQDNGGGATPGVGVFNNNAGGVLNMNKGWFSVGRDGGKGTFNNSGTVQFDPNNADGYINIGRWNQNGVIGDGTFINENGGVLTNVRSEFNVGRDGAIGYVHNKAGGTIFVQSDLANSESFVGLGSGSSGTIDNDGSFRTGMWLNVGRDLGAGTFNNRAGGVSEIERDLQVGMWGGIGVYDNQAGATTIVGHKDGSAGNGEARIGMGFNGNGSGVALGINNGDFRAGSIYIGRDGGIGTFNQESGTLHTQGNMWVGTGTGDNNTTPSQGTFNITGGTVISDAGDFMVGFDNIDVNGVGGTATVNLSSGTLDVNAGGNWANIGRTDKLGNVGGGLANVGIFNLSGDGQFTAHDRTLIGKDATGFFNQTGAASSAAFQVIEIGREGGVGHVTVDDGTFHANQEIQIGGENGNVALTNTPSTFTVNGGNVSSDVGIGVGFAAGTYGELTVTNGTVSTTGLGIGVGYGDNTNGNMAVSGGTVNATGLGIALGTDSIGNVSQTGGTVNLGASGLVIAPGVGGSGGYNLDGGLLNLDGNDVTLAGAFPFAYFAMNGGELRAVETFNTSLVNNGGIVNPGATLGGGNDGLTGTMNVQGDFTDDAASTLHIDIGGTGAGQSDQLAATGVVSLNGTLALNLVRGFVPNTGNYFPAVSAGGGIISLPASITGTNLSAVNPATPATAVFQLNRITDVPQLNLGFLAALPGDADLNKVVEFADLGILLNNYNAPNVGGVGEWSVGDFNDDHVSDFSDLGILLNNYNAFVALSASAPPLAGVPEPSSWALLALGALGVASLRLRRRQS